jgi:hypothetical protein
MIMTITYESRVYNSLQLRPENHAPRHRAPAERAVTHHRMPLMKRLGLHALKETIVSSVAAAKQSIAATKDNLAERIAIIRQDPPENNWDVLCAPQATEGRPSGPIEPTSMAMLDLMLSERYVPVRLERAEYHFVSGIATACELSASAGRMVGRFAMQTVHYATN